MNSDPDPKKLISNHHLKVKKKIISNLYLNLKRWATFLGSDLKDQADSLIAGRNFSKQLDSLYSGMPFFLTLKVL